MSSIAIDLRTATWDELTAAQAAIAGELACRPAPESPVVCMEQAERLGQATDMFEAALATLVRRVDRTGVVREWGHSGTTAWLTSALGMRHGRAIERLTLARQLERLPIVAKLLRGGELSYGYAATTAEAVNRLSDEDCAAAEQILLEMMDEEFSAQQVHKTAQRITDPSSLPLPFARDGSLRCTTVARSFVEYRRDSVR